MADVEQTPDMDELIGKYLTGEAQTAEKAVVEDWIALSAANRKYFQQLETIYTRATPAWQTFNTDAAWNRVKTRIDGGAGRVVPMAPSVWLFAKVAASLLLVLAVGYFVYTSRNAPAAEVVSITSGEGTLDKVLPDGSEAFLNKGTSISYTVTPEGNKRQVKLEGEAFFEVEHREDAPFIILAEDVFIEDLGTAFNVRAYPGGTVVEVLVITGEVAFYTQEDKGIKVKAGERGIYDRATKSFSWFSGLDTNTLAYKTRAFRFQDEELGTVVDMLNRVYEKKIRLKHDGLKSCRLNVAFKGEAIDVIAGVLAETLGLKVTTTEQEILLDGNGCGE